MFFWLNIPTKSELVCCHYHLLGIRSNLKQTTTVFLQFVQFRSFWSCLTTCFSWIEWSISWFMSNLSTTSFKRVAWPVDVGVGRGEIKFTLKILDKFGVFAHNLCPFRQMTKPFSETFASFAGRLTGTRTPRKQTLINSAS